MAAFVCFLLVPTGETVKEECHCSPECKEIVEKPFYKRLDTGEVAARYPWNWGPGAMWNSKHTVGDCPYWDNCDGNHLTVVTPSGGHWNTNSRASNCTMKADRQHRCWVVHGMAPKLTVDKEGLTCRAGAGSIQSGKWHGFLTNGILSPTRQRQ